MSKRRSSLAAYAARQGCRLLWGAALFLAACSSDSSPAEPPSGMSPHARAYLQEVLDIMQARSVHRLRIDWPSFRLQVTQAAGAAQSPAATYPAIRVALQLLGDGHSSLRLPGGAIIHAPTRICRPPLRLSTTAATRTSPMALDDIGYVWVGGFSGSPDQATAFADSIVSAIRMQDDRAAVVGWIVDLRGNRGGNMWPMIAGLGPIIGEGVLGYFIYPGGEAMSWGYQNGASRLGSADVQRVTTPYRLRRQRPPVAVIIDVRVASSGEATAIAFKKRPNTRFFGTPTCGLSTANVGFPLSDGAHLFLSVAVMADRERTSYGDQVLPDEIVSNPEHLLPRATAWLRSVQDE